MMSNGDHRPPSAANGLGIAGFVVSMLGLFGSCGLLSPIGLILSIAALGRQPKGFAVAGVVIGAVGTCFVLLPLVVLAVFLPVVLVAALAAVGLAAVAGPELSSNFELAQIEHRIDGYKSDHGALPMTLDDLKIAEPDALTDYWGRPYAYELAPDGMSYRLFSPGPDGQPGTADDVQPDPNWHVDIDQIIAIPPGNQPPGTPTP